MIDLEGGMEDPSSLIDPGVSAGVMVNQKERFASTFDKWVDRLYGLKMSQGASMYFGAQGEKTEDMEALEVHLSLPCVWKVLADYGHHHAVWYTK